MLDDSERITWLASYPKSGNTWLRCLLQGYRTNGYVDINDLYTGVGDASACYTRAVSPLALSDLGPRGGWLIRPAALLAAMVATPIPRMFKTHYANVVLPGLPAFIPFELTQRAIYVVRDPRSVVLSFSKYFGVSIPQAVKQMANNEFQIAEQSDTQTPQVVSGWSNHVKSWASETKFPVHFVRYEDIESDPERELREIIVFLGMEYDPTRGYAAIEASDINRLRDVENEKGFRDNKHEDRGQFFGAGGTRWEAELGPRWIKQIEADHGEVMAELGYLDEPAADLRAV